MNIRDHNRTAWNGQVERGNRWTVPVSAETVAGARQGRRSRPGLDRRPDRYPRASEVLGCPAEVTHMRKESYSFLKKILETPSPSGFEQPVQRIIRERMKPFAERIETDVHGNVVAAINAAIDTPMVSMKLVSMLDCSARYSAWRTAFTFS